MAVSTLAVLKKSQTLMAYEQGFSIIKRPKELRYFHSIFRKYISQHFAIL